MGSKKASEAAAKAIKRSRKDEEESGKDNKVAKLEKEEESSDDEEEDESAPKIEQVTEDESVTFESFGLDARLSQAIVHMQFTKPTLVQAKAIPLALEEKKDIIARARTGSGKTVAYAIPIIESILQEESASSGNRCVVLVPSRELAEQVTKLFKKLTTYCTKAVGVVNVAQNTSDAVVSSLLAAKPAVIIGTPSRVLAHINSGAVDPKGIAYLVIDEADLILSYGYDEDLKQLAEVLPVKKTAQTWLMSATLSDEIEEMKASFCRKNLAVLKLDDEEAAQQANKKNTLLQYYVKTGELDKFLLAYVIFKLNLIKGKTLIFVNDIDRCYRLKLFLEQFGIRSCVLNAELPVASRLHIVDEFNKNVYNILIATDENTHYSKDGEDENEEQVKEETKEETKEEVKAEDKKSSKKSKKNKKDNEYNVSRGIDFQNIACVLNFDLPTSSTVYTHRVGRTARGDQSGMALSFVVPREQFLKHRPSSCPTAKKDEKILGRVIKQQEKRRKKDLKQKGLDETSNEGENDASVKIQPYLFDMKQVESFRYRMEDAFRAVTRVAVREARVKEIRQELLASEKLKRHFEENPDDLINLRHDRELHPSRVQTHLKRIPDYLMPGTSESAKRGRADLGFIGINKKTDNRIRKAHQAKALRGKKQKRDPLKNFRK